MQKVQGLTKTMWFPKTASTTWAVGAMMIFDGSGNVTKATSTSSKLLGLSLKATASTDTDYALNTLIPIEVPVEKYVVFNALTASAVAADIGASVDLTDEQTVNRGGTSHHVVTIVGVVSATSVNVVINAAYDSVAGA